MKRRTKKKIYNKTKEVFQKTYMILWLISMYFAIGLHRFAPADAIFCLKIFIALSFLAVPKTIIYFKAEKHRDELYQMMKRG